MCCPLALSCLSLGASECSPPQQFAVSLSGRSPSLPGVPFVSCACHSPHCDSHHAPRLLWFGTFCFETFWFVHESVLVLEFHKTFMCIFPLGFFLPISKGQENLINSFGIKFLFLSSLLIFVRSRSISESLFSFFFQCTNIGDVPVTLCSISKALSS